MYFCMVDECEPDWFSYTIRIKNDEELDFSKMFCPPTFFDCTANMGKGCLYGDLKFKKISKLIQQRETLLPNGTLTVLVNIKNEIRERKSDPSADLAYDLEYVFPDLEHTDFTIICGEEKIPCHAFMLTAR